MLGTLFWSILIWKADNSWHTGFGGVVHFTTYIGWYWNSDLEQEMTAMWDKKMETQAASTKIPICFDSKKRVNIYTLGYVPHRITAIFLLVSQAVPSIPDAHRALKTMFSWQTLVYDVSKILLMDEPHNLIWDRISHSGMMRWSYSGRFARCYRCCLFVWKSYCTLEQRLQSRSAQIPSTTATRSFVGVI